MRTLFNLLLLMSMCNLVIAQKVTTPPKETSDPKAKLLLEKVRKQYEAYSSIEASFTLSIEIPSQKKEVQKGSMIQQGERYKVAMENQAVYCDGKTLWIHNIKGNEVQINNADSGSGDAIMSPKDLMKMYQSNEYIYAITGEDNENGKPVTLIEFKPTKRSSDYSKLRVAIDKKNNQVVSIKAFGRDGSRYTMSLEKIIPNKKYAPALFVFDKAKFPKVKVEDLRID